MSHPMTNPTQPAEGMPERWQLVPVEPTIRQMAAMGPAIRASVGLDGKSGNVVDVYRAALAAAPKAPPMPDDVYGAMLSTIGAASMYLSREQMKPFIDWLKAQGFTKE